MQRSVKFAGIAVVIGLAAYGCAGAPDHQGQNDPFEQTNRVIFKANMTMDKAVAKPVAKLYVDAVPEFARAGVHNVLHNLGKPVVLGNDVLQLEGHRAGETFVRFVTNSTLGLGGLIDIATIAGVPDHDEDFGQTLAVWGVSEGPYLMLPMLGPSSPRDATGMGADMFMDPLTYAHYNYENLANDLRIGFKLVDTRAQMLDGLDAIERSSIDFYATTRSLYRQSRKSEIANGRSADSSDDIDLPPDDPVPQK